MNRITLARYFVLLVAPVTALATFPADAGHSASVLSVGLSSPATWLRIGDYMEMNVRPFRAARNLSPKDHTEIVAAVMDNALPVLRHLNVRDLLRRDERPSPGDVLRAAVKTETIDPSGGSADEPRVTYLSEPLPVTQVLLALSQPVEPGEVWRVAAQCAGTACMHFDGSDCQLARRTVELLQPVSADLPLCRIRPRCRWWRQEGKSACHRCPAIVTENYLPEQAVREAAKPR